VIGNPPYVRHQKISPLKPFFKNRYNIYTGLTDLYVYFFEKGFNILKNGGMFSFICSNKFTRSMYGKPLRKLILDYQLIEYIDYTGKNVFEDATVDHCTIIIKKEFKKSECNININNKFTISQDRLDENSWSFQNIENLDLMDKLLKVGKRIVDISGLKIYRGILTGNHQIFVIDKKTYKNLLEKNPNVSNILKPVLRGKDIEKWKMDYQNLFLILLIENDIEKLKKIYPSIYNYLKEHEDQLTSRSQVKRGDHPWWVISNNPSNEYLNEFQKEKIIWSELSNIPSFLIDENNFLVLDTLLFMTIENVEYNLGYFCSLLNSKLVFWLFKQMSSSLGVKGLRFKKIYVDQIPIYSAAPDVQIPFIEKADEMHQLNKDLNSEINGFKDWLKRPPYNIDKFSQKLDKYYELSFEDFLAELKKKKVDIKKRKTQELLKNEFTESINVINPLLIQIKETDKEIDKMVYDLYGLTDEEIKIIEESLNN
jgi:hypothetical protein